MSQTVEKLTIKNGYACLPSSVLTNKNTQNTVRNTC